MSHSKSELPSYEEQLNTMLAELQVHHQTAVQFKKRMEAKNTFLLEGTFEAHSEKVAEAIEELNFALGDNAIQRGNRAPSVVGMEKPILRDDHMLKKLVSNLRYLTAKVRKLRMGTGQPHDRATQSTLQELSRNLQNDLSRMSYMLA